MLILKTGERLRTLHDAAELITRRFGSVTKSAPLEHAIGLLLRAAKTGTRADRKAATDQVAFGAAAERDELSLPQVENGRRKQTDQEQDRG